MSDCPECGKPVPSTEDAGVLVGWQRDDEDVHELRVHSGACLGAHNDRSANRQKCRGCTATFDPRTGEQYFELEYSDRLLEMRLRALDPAKYRDKKVEHSGPGGGAIPVLIVNVGKKADDASR